MPDIDRREKGERLDEQDQRGRESAHERQAISRPDREINQRQRPGQKDEDLEKIRDRTTPEIVSAHRQERTLEKKSESDGDEVEAPRPKHSVTQSRDGMRDRDEKADCRKEDELSIHGGIESVATPHFVHLPAAGFFGQVNEKLFPHAL